MKNNNFKLSVIVPILNEEGNIEVLIEKATNVLGKYQDYELLFVDDGSTDGTLRIIQTNIDFSIYCSLLTINK